jgi:hypothetical protein
LVFPDSIFSSSPTHISSIIFFSFQLPYPPIITWPTSILFYFTLPSILRQS